MVKRRLTYKKKRQNRLAVVMVIMVVLLLMVVVGYRGIQLQARQEAYQEQITNLEQQIEAEKQRTEEIDEYRKYTQTKKYMEEVAKDKLGLVREGEILFKEESD